MSENTNPYCVFRDVTKIRTKRVRARRSRLPYFLGMFVIGCCIAAHVAMVIWHNEVIQFFKELAR